MKTINSTPTEAASTATAGFASSTAPAVSSPTPIRSTTCGPWPAINEWTDDDNREVIDLRIGRALLDPDYGLCAVTNLCSGKDPPRYLP